MKTEEKKALRVEPIKNHTQINEAPESEVSNFAMIKLLERQAAESLKTTRHTSLRSDRTETAEGDKYSYKIDIERRQTVRLGQSEDGKSLLVSTNPKNREDFHDDPKTSINSEHNEIFADVGTVSHRTAELKIDRSEEEDFRGFAEKTARDKKISDYGNGIDSVFSALSSEKERKTFDSAREIRKSTKNSEEKTELLRVENTAENALGKREQLETSIKAKAESIINALEFGNDSESDGFFDILLKRKRTPEEKDSEDDFEINTKEEDDEGHS